MLNGCMYISGPTSYVYIYTWVENICIYVNSYSGCVFQTSRLRECVRPSAGWCRKLNTAHIHISGATPYIYIYIYTWIEHIWIYVHSLPGWTVQTARLWERVHAIAGRRLKLNAIYIGFNLAYIYTRLTYVCIYIYGSRFSGWGFQIARLTRRRTQFSEERLRVNPSTSTSVDVLNAG